MTTLTHPTTPAPTLNLGLWAAQIAVAAVFLIAGFMKLTMGIPELAEMVTWAGDHPAWFVRTIGAIDLAGGIGILLPALTRIRPQLTVLAALGCAALQVCALVFHLSRGELPIVPLNVLLIALSLFVAWGRSRKIPILPRA